MDEAVGKFVPTLREAGQLDNTYLLFSSNNGFFFGRHNVPPLGSLAARRVGARADDDARVPGINGGTPSREMSSNVDLAAAIADIGGARPGLTLGGWPLLPFARDRCRRTDRSVVRKGAGGARSGPVSEGGSAKAGDDAASGRRVAEGD
ncbi:hypothetical protein ACQEU8_19625 [Streptomyces sp. CA-250714]|uniref:hypothetical protein n=1 Tax=Streptomyces sp. CA-250714 TaxID=3240060 RepID=UPI003D8D9852